MPVELDNPKILISANSASCYFCDWLDMQTILCSNEKSSCYEKDCNVVKWCKLFKDIYVNYSSSKRGVRRIRKL